MKTSYLIILIASSLFTSCVDQQSWVIKSPDGKIQVTVANRDSLIYSVTFEDKPVILPSPLGLELDDQDLSTGLVFKKEDTTSVDESYTLLAGKCTSAGSRANETQLTFEGRDGREMVLVVRAYNDGMAFRYMLPQTDSTLHKMTAERSGFSIPTTATGWIQPYDLNSRKKPCYETFYENGITPGASSPNPAGWAFPALFDIGGTWVLITEAGLDESYCACHLEDSAGRGLYTIRWPEKEEVTSDANPEPVSTLPWYTPWRLAVIGPSPSTVLSTTRVTDLSPPSKIDDTSWIKPGRASWSWWSDGSTPRKYDVQKAYIDFTSNMGWDYVLIDAGWPRMEGGSMEDLVKYASSKGVGIFLWYHSGMGREQDSVSMANLMAFPVSRRAELQKIKRWGVKGVKVDFFDGDKQPVIKRYFDILKDAARYQIMVNFHGSTLPRGWERTWPHVMSMESVKGAEGLGRQEACDKAPVLNTILPFTRNAVGPMDYTPVTFTNKREAIRRTTYGHELALSVVFQSGIFHFADNMNSYLALPEEPMNFLKKVPVAWDETRYLAGRPGSYVVVARRKGSVWFMGGINGEDRSIDINFDISFLQGPAKWSIITDGVKPETFQTKIIETVEGKVSLTLQPYGGFVATVSP